MRDRATRTGRPPRLALATAAAAVSLTGTASSALTASVIDDWQDPASGSLAEFRGSFSQSTVLDEAQRRLTTSIDTTSPFAETKTSVESGTWTWQFRGNRGMSAGLTYNYFSPKNLSAYDTLLLGTIDTADGAGLSPDTGSSSGADFSLDIEINGNAIANPLTFNLNDEGDLLTVDVAAFSNVDFGKVNTIELALEGSYFEGEVTLSGGLAAVPVPGALPLFLSAVAGLGYVARRRRREAAAA
jgi:hypothetical protein